MQNCQIFFALFAIFCIIVQTIVRELLSRSFFSGSSDSSKQ
ncbi:hypothetical Protein YC6258_05951 [Gynuella sunshinyii YC6258]|uniref:Uncharacterized protein n=1 Tax=Gynuella sunshinyii YC6258 TaxID=1445510 RepID=A0A0C5VFC7_9GAMM|nr:hypothetical Protein YC6258_05951 [Gynuella sunshinyii YC6258]